MRSTTVQKFDVRDAVCLAAGGFKHGQVLEDADGELRLWVHVDGAWGAGVVKEYDEWRRTAKVVGRKQVIPAPLRRWPKDFGRNLRRSFSFPCGMKPNSPVEYFDVRDETCRDVGGFVHGQVVRDPDGDELTAIGVKMSGGQPRLFFLLAGAPGAGTIDSYDAVRPLLKPVKIVK